MNTHVMTFKTSYHSKKLVESIKNCDQFIRSIYSWPTLPRNFSATAGDKNLKLVPRLDLGYVLYVHILLVEFWEGAYSRTMLNFFDFSLQGIHSTIFELQKKIQVDNQGISLHHAGNFNRKNFKLNSVNYTHLINVFESTEISKSKRKTVV